MKQGNTWSCMHHVVNVQRASSVSESLGNLEDTFLSKQI